MEGDLVGKRVVVGGGEMLVTRYMIGYPKTSVIVVFAALPHRYLAHAQFVQVKILRPLSTIVLSPRGRKVAELIPILAVY